MLLKVTGVCYWRKTKKEFGLESVKDEELTMKFKTKLRFKTFIKKKAVKLASEYLGKLKDKHSKLDDISFTKLEPATYLFDSRNRRSYYLNLEHECTTWKQIFQETIYLIWFVTYVKPLHVTNAT